MRTNALLLLEPGRDPKSLTSDLWGGGWTVTLADTPAAALALAAANDFGLLVISADLELMANGLHPAIALRRITPNVRPPRLVLVAASVDKRVESLAANAGAYRIALLPTTPVACEDAPEAELTTTERRPSVWVVDDSPAIRLLAGRAFERSGWHVTELEDLHSARTKLLTGAKPQAVLLDIFLPDGNGLDYVECFTAVGAVVVMVSDLAGPDQVERAFRAGAVDIVSKPLNMRSLVARVEHALSGAHWHATGTAPTAPPANADQDDQRFNDLRI